MVELALIVVMIALQSSGQLGGLGGLRHASMLVAAIGRHRTGRKASGDGLGAIGDFLWPAGCFARLSEDHLCRFPPVTQD
jgi:hypothetical protein